MTFEVFISLVSAAQYDLLSLDAQISISSFSSFQGKERIKQLVRQLIFELVDAEASNVIS